MNVMPQSAKEKMKIEWSKFIPGDIFHRLYFLFRCTISVCNLYEQTAKQKRSYWRELKWKKNSRKKNKLITEKQVLKIKKLCIMWLLTLTVPEQAQGASKVSTLSNSSSWQILQRGIAESSFKSSTSKTTSAIYFTPNDLSFFKFQPLFSNSVGYSVFSFPFYALSISVFSGIWSLYMKEKTNRISNFAPVLSLKKNKY